MAERRPDGIAGLFKALASTLRGEPDPAVLQPFDLPDPSKEWLAMMAGEEGPFPTPDKNQTADGASASRFVPTASEYAATSHSTANRDSQKAVPPETAERLTSALNQLESVAPPDAYWYLEQRAGPIDRLVEWIDSRKSADSRPSLLAAVQARPANRGLALAAGGLAVSCVALGAIVGLQSSRSRTPASVSAASRQAQPLASAPEGQSALNSDPSSVNSYGPTRTSESPASISLTPGVPEPGVTITESPALAAPSEVADSARVQPDLPDSPSPTDLSSPPAVSALPKPPVVVWDPRRSEMQEPRPAASGPSATVERESDPPSVEAPPRRPRQIARSEASPRVEPAPSRPRTARRVPRLPSRPNRTRERAERRVDREAEAAFREEYRRRETRKRRAAVENRRRPDEANTQVTSPVDPRNPNWGWD